MSLHTPEPRSDDVRNLRGSVMRVLTVRQPWADLIINHGKDVENRSWRTTYRGPLVIHAGATEDTAVPIKPYPFPLGGIIGVVDLIDCVRDHPSNWAQDDCWHWVLENPRPLPFRAMKGKLGLWTIADRLCRV